MPRPRHRLDSEQPRARPGPAAHPDREVSLEGGSEDGVDESLIRWMLSLTPTERLEWAQNLVDTVEALREGREPYEP